MNHKHQKTLAKIFAHPITHDLKWNDVLKLFEALDVEMTVQHSGKTLVSLNGVEAVLPRHTHKNVSNQNEVMDLRHFLQNAGVSP